MRTLLLATALGAIPATGTAVPVTLEFTGTVVQYFSADNSATPVDLLGTLSHLNASGTITWDLSLGPPAVLTSSPGVYFQYEQELLGTPAVEFVSSSITWAPGVFTSSPIPIRAGATERGDQFALVNSVNGVGDLLVLADTFGWDAPDGAFGLNGVVLNSQGNFLADAAGFPDGTMLPDFSTIFTQVVLLDFVQEASGLGKGFAAVIIVDSGTVRQAVAVPAPGTLVLLLAGFAAGALVRRKRAV